MKRIGIFGGTFNPPHIGHSIIADDVREQMHLDKILFIPSGIHPLKEGNKLMATPEQRYEMANLAFGDNKYFEVSDIEVKNKTEKSYTVDTLIKLKELYKEEFVNLYLILSTDNKLISDTIYR